MRLEEQIKKICEKNENTKEKKNTEHDGKKTWKNQQ